jgi:hypothetical protein
VVYMFAVLVCIDYLNHYHYVIMCGNAFCWSVCSIAAACFLSFLFSLLLVSHHLALVDLLDKTPVASA